MSTNLSKFSERLMTSIAYHAYRNPIQMKPKATPRVPAFMTELLSKFRNRPLASQMRKHRHLVVYIACVLFLLITLNLDVLFSHRKAAHAKRPSKAQLPETSRKKLAGSTFPQKIGRHGRLPLLFGVMETSRAMTWVQRNPQMRYEVITDHNDMTYIESFYGPEGLIA